MTEQVAVGFLGLFLGAFFIGGLCRFLLVSFLGIQTFGHDACSTYRGCNTGYNTDCPTEGALPDL
eukprot:gene21664-25718_t